MGFKEATDNPSRDQVVAAVQIQRLDAFSQFTNSREASFNFLTNEVGIRFDVVVERLDADPVPGQRGEAGEMSSEVFRELDVSVPFTFVAATDGRFRITVTSDEDNAEDSHEWVIDTVPPSAPGNLRIVARTLDSMTLRWDQAFDVTTDVVAYRIRYGLEADGLALAGKGALVAGLVVDSGDEVGNVLTIRMDGLRPACRTFAFQAAAVDAAGNESAPSNTATETLVCGPLGTFEAASAINLPTGSAPVFVLANDFDGDGLTDLAVILAASSEVTVLLNEGDGAFSTAAVLTAEPNPFYLDCGDFNSDQVPDLVVLTRAVLSADETIRVFLGDGAGGFVVQPAVSTIPFGDAAQPVVVGCFNDDSYADLLGISGLVTGARARFGQGVGGVANGLFVSEAVGGPSTIDPQSVVAADFTCDGVPDILVANKRTTQVTLFPGESTAEGRPSGFFRTAGTKVPVGGFVGRMVAADFNGDGIPDAAAVASSGLRVLLGQPPGAGAPFSNLESFFGDASAAHLVAHDLNADGLVDVAVANAGSDSISVYFARRDPESTFAPALVLSAGDGASGIAAADMNGDGIPDLVTADTNAHSLSILLGKGGSGGAVGGFEIGPVLPIADYPVDLRLGDLNLDNAPDLIVLANGGEDSTGNGEPDGRAALYAFLGAHVEGRPTGAFGAPFVTELGLGESTDDFEIRPGRAVFVADFDGDSIPDAAVTRGNISSNGTLTPGGSLTTSHGTGDGAFLPPSAAGAVFGQIKRPIAVADLNRDAALDVVFLQPEFIAYALGHGESGKGDGTFPRRDQIPYDGLTGGVDLETVDVAVADVNGDAIPDLLFSPPDAHMIQLILGNGSDGVNVLGTFSLGAQVPSGPDPGRIATGDFDGDRITDIAVCNTSAATVSILKGNGASGRGNGTFEAPVTANVGNNPSFVATADFDKDGNLDLAVANRDDDTVTILSGDGSGSFAESADSPLLVGDEPTRIVVADFNGDTIPDLAVLCAGDRTLRIFFGENARDSTPSGE